MMIRWMCSEFMGSQEFGATWPLAAGLWTTAAIPGNDTNVVFGGNSGQLMIQLKAVVYTLVYSGIVSFVLLKLVDLKIGLKATEHNEYWTGFNQTRRDGLYNYGLKGVLK